MSETPPCSSTDFESSEAGAQKDFNNNSAEAGGHTAVCNHEDADLVKLVKVEFLDGSEEKLLANNDVQYVNLPGEEKWIDGKHVKNIDRLGRKPRIYVQFDKPGNHKFKLKLYDLGVCNRYSSEEKQRNEKFKYHEDEISFTTEATGEKVISDMLLSVGGGDTFSVIGTDEHGIMKGSKNLLTKRLLYFQEVKMSGAVGADAAANLNMVSDEFEKHHLTLSALPELTVAAMENIGSNDELQQYMTSIEQAFENGAGKEKLPYCTLIGYTSHLAVKGSAQEVVKKRIAVGPDAPEVEMTMLKPLWYGIKTGESWWVDSYYQESDGAGGYLEHRHQIPETKCALVPSDNNPNYFKQLKIDVSNLPAGTGKVVLQVNWINQMKGGMAFRTSNCDLICVCTKVWWTKNSTEKQNKSIIHEMGHTLGMTPDGTGSNLDKIATYYDNANGHNGPHCYKGNPDGEVRYDTKEAYNNATCVMYGATCGNSAFCDNCEKAVKKQDMTKN